jgi:hypothetical protein
MEANEHALKRMLAFLANPMKWLIIILCAVAAQIGSAAEVKPGASHHDYLVGIYYFAGCWRKSPNKWETAGHNWRPDYPERIPLLGEYNDQATMDREIVAAATHGVDFFQILWYPNRARLNEGLQGLRTFTTSTNAPRMRFTIELPGKHPTVTAQSGGS